MDPAPFGNPQMGATNSLAADAECKDSPDPKIDQWFLGMAF